MATIKDSIKDLQDNFIKVQKKHKNTADNAYRLSQNVNKELENVHDILDENVVTDAEETIEVYNKDIPNGVLDYAEIKTLGGKTVVFNQLIDKSYILNVNINGITSKYSHGNYNIYINGTSTDSIDTPILKIPNIIPNHIYYFYGLSTSLCNCIDAYDSNGNLLLRTKSSNNWMCYFRIQAPENTNYFCIVLLLDSGKTFTDYCNPKCIDMTLLLGKGNEPDTYDECLPIITISNILYNEGELISFKPNKILSRGSNIYNENNLSINNVDKDDNGWYTIKDTTSYICSLNKIPWYNLQSPIHMIFNTKLLEEQEEYNTNINTEFSYLTLNEGISGNGYAHVIYNDENILKWTTGNWIHYGLGLRRSHYISFNIIMYTVTTGRNLFKIKMLYIGKDDINFSGTDPDPLPYYEDSIELDDVISKLTLYGVSAGESRNWIDWENGVYHQEVGEYTFDGSEDWYQWGDCVALNTKDMIKDAYEENTDTGYYITNYGVDYNNTSYNYDSNMCTYYNVSGCSQWIGLHRKITVADAKEMFSNRNLVMYYRLANPIITDISDILPSNMIKVFKDGTILFMDTTQDNVYLPSYSHITYQKKVSTSE